ncbi:MAG: malto-oligosyltrehalose synthase [Leptolyngbyaceae cyanobacterium bins.59]|nr:malto-oligosyltrehalose synthase [Leptolyngbyaceae cyanobacterium bins.59]
MRVPTATYRIQFNSGFRFEDAANIVSYLAELGISDLYASPIFQARIGSSHGYDVVNPNQLNSELGTPEDFETLMGKIQSHQMGWLQDIVPNHMAYDSQNQWLMDVMENGPDSNYVTYFDIAWNSPFGNSQEPILAPMLGNFYGDSLEKGEIQVKYDESGLSVNYYSLKLPLKLESYATFLTQHLGRVARTLGRKHPDFIKILGILYVVKNLSSEVVSHQRQDQSDFVKGLLWELYTSNPEIQTFIDDNIKLFNGEPGNPDSFNLLDRLLSEQFYRLSYWKVGAEDINYRRFFTVNELISVKVEELKVFQTTHDMICRFVQEGKFTGLRIDHIDGLYNPTEYLHRLREKVGDTYITVEKILQPGENLPDSWPTQGTSGYDYLNYLNGVFCKTENCEPFDTLYQEFTGSELPFDEVVAQKKHLILDKNLAGDIDNLATLAKKISEKYRYGNDFTLNGLKRALAEVLTRFPVYRTYADESGISAADRTFVEEVIRDAKETVPLLLNELNFLEKLLLLDYDASLTSTEKAQWLYFVMRVQQYTGPLMAKGVEDTAFYVYNRLISLNEVGGNPEHFGISAQEFHEFNRVRQERWFSAMSATSTHDTKRGEDTRARMNVLSELPEEWRQQVQSWSKMNRRYKVKFRGQLLPDRNDEYAIYQTLVGAFPFHSEEFPEFVDRVKDYVIKAIRESKVYTAWLRPNPDYEKACTDFVDAILSSPEENPFLQSLQPFQQKIAFYGIFNSLSQVLLKAASPGVPDFYQGTELWDFSLVDPDNRRPVNFERRQACLHSLKERVQQDISGLVNELLAHKEDARLKLFLTMQLLKARTQYLQVFQEGAYILLEMTGEFQDHLIAFARKTNETTALVIAPRFLTSLVQPGELPLGSQVWQDTGIKLPGDFPVSWQDAIVHQSVAAQDGVLPVGEVLQKFPVALLINN